MARMITHDEMRTELLSRYPEIWKSVRGFEFDVGWGAILDAVSRVLVSLDPVPAASVVKEKFGGLRAGFYPWNEEVRAVVECAQRLSERTCELTGARGRLVSRRGRWQTLAPGLDPHALTPAEYQARYPRDGVSSVSHPPITQTVDDVAARFPKRMLRRPSLPNGYADILECLARTVIQPTAARLTFDGLEIELETEDPADRAVARFCTLIGECCDPFTGTLTWR